MAEMNIKSAGERWGAEIPVQGVEARGESAIGKVARGTREGIADVDGILPPKAVHRPDLRAYLSTPTPVEEQVMSFGEALGGELGDILPSRTSRPDIIPAELRARRPDIYDAPVWN